MCFTSSRFFLKSACRSVLRCFLFNYLAISALSSDSVSDVLASRPLTAELEARCSWQRAVAQILILKLIVILQQNGGMQVIPRQNGGMQVIPRQNGGMPDSMVGTQI